MIFAVGQTCPIEIFDGFRLRWEGRPMLLIGLHNVTPQEVRAARIGRIVHRFGANQHTAWIVLYFCDADGVPLMGEIFYSAAAQPDEFTDQRLSEMRADLPPDAGFACQLILANSNDQRIQAMRVYAWSNELSLAFLDACERTRASFDQMTAAQHELLRYPTTELANRAFLTFDLPALDDC